MSRITRPALRYHGSKFRIARWIIDQFPAHICYCEPFGGAASVLLQKEPAAHEVYNDLDAYVVGFFSVLRNEHKALIEAIRWTPYSRTELKAAWADKGEPGTVEAARRLYVRAYQSFSNAPAHDSTGWRFTKAERASAVRQFNNIDALYVIAERLRNVQIECRDALDVMRDFDTPDTLHYVDPPYVLSSRNTHMSGRGYLHELTDDDHLKLIELIKNLSGYVILSGYDTELYRENIGSDWICRRRVVGTLVGSSRNECLWLSPNINARQASMFQVWGAS